MFSLKDVVVNEGGGKYIRAGINDNVVIASITPSEDGKPYLEFAFKLKDAGDDAVSKQRIYLTDNALVTSQKKIMHIATKLISEDAAKAIDGSTLEAYAKNLSKALVAQSQSTPLRMKFNGEEYVNASGDTKVKAVLGLPTFAELQSVPAEKSKLTYDANSKWDFKHLPKADAEVGDSNTSNAGGLPF